MAWRMLVLSLALGTFGVACEDGKGSDVKSEKDDDDAKDKKKKKKKKKSDDDDDDAQKGDKPAKAPGSATPPPAETADAVAPAPEPAPAPAPAAEPAAPCGAMNEIPDIPAEKSDAPKDLAEWSTGCPVNTQGANSHAPDCTSVLKREWLKVTCTGDMRGYEQMDGFGVEGRDYFKLFSAGKMISFVVRLRKGASQKVRMCRPKERASLFVSWPPSKDKPTIIAVGIGPKCEKF